MGWGGDGVDPAVMVQAVTATLLKMFLPLFPPWISVTKIGGGDYRQSQALCGDTFPFRSPHHHHHRM